jgi:hypothetical protein
LISFFTLHIPSSPARRARGSEQGGRDVGDASGEVGEGRRAPLTC